MRRTASYVVFGVGLLLLVAGLLKLLPGIGGAGAGFMFWGLILFGLSFIPRPVPEPGDPPVMSPVQRIFGLFYMPTDVFRSLRYNPSWLLPLILVTIITGAYTIAFTKRVTPERIADQETVKMFGKFVENGWMPADAVAKMREDRLQQLRSRVALVGEVVSGVATHFIFRMLLPAGLFMLLILVFGGRINFWQALAVSSYAALPITVVTKILSFVVLYLKDPALVHPVLGRESLVQDNLGVLLDPAQSPVLFVLASVIGVLSFYGIWLYVTGLRNAGEKVSKGAAWGTMLLITGVAIGLGLAVAVFFPGLFS